MGITSVRSLITLNSNRIRTNFSGIRSLNRKLETSSYIWKSEDSWIYCTCIIIIDCIVAKRSTNSICHWWGKVRNHYINCCCVYLICLSCYSCTCNCGSWAIINYGDTYHFIVSVRGVWSLVTFNSNWVRTNFCNVRSRNWDLKASSYIWKSKDSWIYCTCIIMINSVVTKRPTYGICHWWGKVRNYNIYWCCVYLICLSSYSCTSYCSSWAIIHYCNTNDFIMSIRSIGTLVTWNSNRVRTYLWNIRSRNW